MQQRPGVGGHHHGTGQGPDHGPGPAFAREPQATHGGQHQHGALRRHAPAAEQGVARCQQHAPHQGRVGRRQPQAQAARAPPQPAHGQCGSPGEHGDVQARDRHEVGDAGGTKHIPVGPLDGPLVAHHQRSQQASLGPVWDCGKDPFPHLLAQPLHRVKPGLAEAPGLGVSASRTHIAGGLHALLPQPKFIVKTMRVAAAMGRLQAHGHLPSLTGLHRLRLALQLGHPLRPRKDPAVPAQIKLRGQTHRRTLPLRRGHRQAKTQTRFVRLGHGHHHAGHREIAPLQFWRQGVRQEEASAQPGQAKTQQRQRQQQRGRPAPICYGMRSTEGPPHKGWEHAEHINPPGVQRRLLQLKRRTGDKGQQAGQQQPGPAPALRWLCVHGHMLPRPVGQTVHGPGHSARVPIKVAAAPPGRAAAARPQTHPRAGRWPIPPPARPEPGQPGWHQNK